MEPNDVGVGLRQRKKQLTRQRISDTATGLFIERGFDQVKVADIAAACDVSEKTVYNYFPTKESLLLDREEAVADDIRRALRPGPVRRSPVEAAVQTLAEELSNMFGGWADTDPAALLAIRRFHELLESTPSLRAAERNMMERLLWVAAEAMAARAGVDPEDPEPQIAADAILGLWRIQHRAMAKYADGLRSAEEIGVLVAADVERAARLIDTGLWSFGLAVQGARGVKQFRLAADAAVEARKQVMDAIRQARSAWKSSARP